MNPPDGGWGWVVMLSTFVISMIIDGVNFTFGIFVPAFLRHFGESKGKTQSLNSVMFGTMSTVGPLAGALMKKYGARRMIISGGLVSSVGIFLSTFSPNLNIMIVLYGVVGGTGFALLYLPAIVMVGMYFDKRRALATGIAVCGSGVGGFVFAPLYEIILDTYGRQGTIWIMSAIILNVVVCAASYRPIGVHENGRQRTLSRNTMHTNIISDCSMIWSSMLDAFDISLLKRPVFLLYGISTFLSSIGFHIPFNFLPSQAVHIHLSTSDAAFLISIIGISNTVARVLIGYVSDKSWADTILINSVALVIGGLATCFVPYYSMFYVMATYSALFGAVIGALSDSTGDYAFTFYFGGITLGLAGLICFPLRWIARWEQRRNVDITRYSNTYSSARKESNASLQSF
ncbi:Monocarboxylate transporter 12 [Mizuhopecten yessoensis]|uniref:Monocarboxylate transporter 12 n=1 Tax=Mizuhopecten yessoensis TaxID=6573 RepID=A0A210QUF2_MIZYE|nr:Monocarboxylate transporter 12 [Mizuhopecten yessoensis]